LAEADDSEGAEGSGKALRSHLDPRGVGDPSLRCRAPGLKEHPGIWIETDDLLEEAGEEEGNGARPAADVEEAPLSVEMEAFGQNLGQV